MKLLVLVIYMTTCLSITALAQHPQDQFAVPSQGTYHQIETFGTKPSTRFAPGDIEDGETGQKVTEETPIGDAELLIYISLALIASAYVLIKRTNIKQKLQ